jgi:hypothetical protein
VTTTSDAPARTDDDEEDRSVTDERHDPSTEENDATSVTGPTGTPPDEGMAYDRSLTDEDEANIPAESNADPEA